MDTINDRIYSLRIQAGISQHREVVHRKNQR